MTLKKNFKYGFLMVAMLVFIAVFTEVMLGVVNAIRYHGREPMTIRDYPYLYYLYDSTGTRNIHGFKTNYPVKKQPGKYRIILTGGSVAMGREPEQSIAHYLEQKLNEQLYTDKIEVVNAGVSAFVAEQVFLNIQLILQQYEPDMIVSLDGFNDLFTFKLNTMHPSDFPLPPHFWNRFRMVEMNKPVVFKNISSAWLAFRIKKIERQYDWSSVPDSALAAVSGTYWEIINDCHDFCQAKNIAYFSFLQPLKENSAPTAQMKTLSTLYRKMEEGVHEKHYAFSLATIFKSRPDIFLDECHVTAEGHQIIAGTMAERIVSVIGDKMEN